MELQQQQFSVDINFIAGPKKININFIKTTPNNLMQEEPVNASLQEVEGEEQEINSKNIKDVNKNLLQQEKNQELFSNKNNINNDPPMKDNSKEALAYDRQRQQQEEVVANDQQNQQQGNNKEVSIVSKSQTKKKRKSNKERTFRKMMTGRNLNLKSLFSRVHEISNTEGVGTMLKVWQFITNLKKFSGFWRPKTVRSKEYELINDISFYQEGTSKKKMNGRQSMIHLTKTLQTMDDMSVDSGGIISRIMSFFDKLPLFEPTDYKIIIWDIIHAIIIIFCIFYLPIEWITGQQFILLYGSSWLYFLLMCTIVFGLDILLNFRIGFYKRGMYVSDRRKIIIRYMKNAFIGDLLSIIPIIESQLNFTDRYRVVNIFIVFKIITINLIFQKYFDLLSIKKQISYPTILRLVRLLFAILFIAHALACLYLGLALLEENAGTVENTWIRKYNADIINEKWLVQYIYALYWAVTTMCTVGYGDITPSNPYETVFVTFAMLFSCGVFAFYINIIGLIVQDINKNKQEFTNKMRLLSRYLEKKRIDKELQIEVHKYLEFRFNAENELSLEEEKAVLDMLSDNIKDKVKISANMQYIMKCPLFAKNFSEKFLLRLALIMQFEGAYNEQVLFEDKETHPNESENMYFIESGCIQIYTEVINNEEQTKNICILKELKRGEYFGEIGFLLSVPRTAFAKSIGSTALLKINKREFLKLLKDYPNDYEKFCMIRDHALVNNNYSFFKTKCYNCEKSGHLVNTCPRLHFIPQKEHIILKNNFNNEVVDRYKKQRASRDVRVHSCFKKFKECQEQAEVLVEELNDENFSFSFLDVNNNDCQSDTSISPRNIENSPKLQLPQQPSPPGSQTIIAITPTNAQQMLELQPVHELSEEVNSDYMYLQQLQNQKSKQQQQKQMQQPQQLLHTNCQQRLSQTQQTAQQCMPQNLQTQSSMQQQATTQLSSQQMAESMFSKKIAMTTVDTNTTSIIVEPGAAIGGGGLGKGKSKKAQMFSQQKSIQSKIIQSTALGTGHFSPPTGESQSKFKLQSQSQPQTQQQQSQTISQMQQIITMQEERKQQEQDDLQQLIDDKCKAFSYYYPEFNINKLIEEQQQKKVVRLPSRNKNYHLIFRSLLIKPVQNPMILVERLKKNLKQKRQADYHIPIIPSPIYQNNQNIVPQHQ